MREGLVVRYGIALSASVAAIGVRMLLTPELGSRAAFLLSTLAVMFSAWLGGLGPGLAATGASTLAAAHLFIQPYTIRPSHVVLQMGLFALTGTGVSLFAQALSSARRAAELNARQALAARDRVRSILESISDGFLALDRDFRFVYVNPAAELVMGVSRGEVIGKCIWDAFPAALHTELERQCCYVMSARKSAHFESAYAPLQKWFSVHAYPSDTGGVAIYFSDITDRKAAESEKELLIEELRDALSKVRQLNGLLPICASCKKIRDDTGYWHQLETYIRSHSEAEFSHGLCPECVQKFYSDFDMKSRPERKPA